MKKQLVMWFDETGNLLEHVYSWVTNGSNPRGRVYKSEEAQDFTDTLEYIKMQDYTRSAARVHLRSVFSGRKYSMFVGDFHDVIAGKKFVDNQVSGTFKFVKRCTAQAIKLVQ
jgi:hypothetical protein